MKCFTKQLTSGVRTLTQRLNTFIPYYFRLEPISDKSEASSLSGGWGNILESGRGSRKKKGKGTWSASAIKESIRKFNIHDL